MKKERVWPWVVLGVIVGVIVGVSLFFAYYLIQLFVTLWQL